MANSILNKVSEELLILEQELTVFKNSVSYLSEAKSHVENAVSAVSLAEKYHLNQLTKLNETYERYDSLSGTVKVLTDKIETVDFPKRLKKIEDTLNLLMVEISTITNTTLGEVRQASALISKTNFESQFSSLHDVIQIIYNETSTIPKTVGLKIDRDNIELEKKITNTILNLTKHLEILKNQFATFEKNINSASSNLGILQNTTKEEFQKLTSGFEYRINILNKNIKTIKVFSIIIIFILSITLAVLLFMI